MKTDTLYDAIGEVRDDFIQDAEQAGKHVRKRSWLPLIAACLALVLLAIPVQAELKNGYVSNLLAPLYGSTQTELADAIGIPLEGSVEVGEYVLTAEAVIGDRYNIAFVYSLARLDGEMIEEGLYFEDCQSSGFQGGFAGGGWRSHKLSEDGKKLHIIDTWQGSGTLFLNRNAKVTFTNLMKDEGAEDSLILEGEWSLQFIVRYEDTGREIPTKDLEVKDELGISYVIEHIYISPVGLHLDVTAPNLFDGLVIEEWPYREFSVAVLLRDDTLIEIEDWNFGGRGRGKTFEGGLSAMFDAPIPLENIKALIICDVTVPVEFDN